MGIVEVIRLFYSLAKNVLITKIRFTFCPEVCTTT